MSKKTVFGTYRTSSHPATIIVSFLAILLGLSLLPLSLPSVFAQATPDQLIFGPQQFLRTGGGAPNEYTETFSIPTAVGEPFLLHIVNGNPDGTNRLSSAWVTINGVQVAGPGDFNQNVAVVDRTVTLQPTNTLEVKVASKTGGFLTISVFGTAILPTPSALTPDPLTVTVGSTGNLTATLTPAPTVAGTLTASSTNTGVATVPASIAFAAGQSSVPVPVTAVGTGSASISVSLNGGTATSTVIATPQPPTVTSLLPGTLTITQGGTGNLTVTISAAQSTAVNVTVASSDAGIAGVSGLVTIPASQTSAPIAVSANTAGTAQITASLNGSTASSTVTVTPNLPTIVSLLPPTNPVDLGGTVILTATISAAQPTDTPLTVTATPSGILTVPAQVIVLAGQTAVSFVVDTVGLGTAMVQVSLNGTTADAAVQVTPPPPEVISLLPSPLPIVVGATGQFTVTLNVAQLTNTDVTLVADNPAIVQVPNTVTVSAGQISATFTVSGLQVGSAVVTASIGSNSVQATVNVLPQPPTIVSLLPNPLEVQMGATGHLTLTINAAQQTDTSVPLNNSAPTIIDVPVSVTVPAGQISVDIPVTGLLEGNATVTASLNGSSAVASVVVTAPPPVVTALTPATQTLPKGVPGVLRVFVSSAPMAPTPVTVTSSAAGIAAVPAMVTIPAGDLFADFPVVTNGEGTAVITASLNGGTATAQVIVTPAELVALTISPQDPSEFLGAQVPFTATGTFTDGTTPDLTSQVTWTSSDETIATIASDGIASTLAVGSTTITATSGTIAVTSILTVLPTPTLTIDPATANMQVGQTVAFTVTSSEPADVSGLTVTLAQSGSGSVTIDPISVVIPVGDVSASFNVTADAGGAVLLTASAPLRTDGTANITIALGPPAITDVTPLTGPVGTPVTITGQSFDPTVGNTQVTFTGASGTITAIVTSITTTTITTTVPQNTITGPITVTTPLGNAASPQQFTVTLSQDFLLSAAPPQVTTLQGGQSNYVLSVTGIGTFTGLVNLAATGLPSGMTAEFTSPALTTGQTGYLTVKTDGTVPAGPVAFTVTGTAPLENGPSTQVLPLTLQVLAGSGQTALSGSFLDTDTEEPIPGVVVNIGTSQATTDAAGNFLLQNLSAGSQKLMISGNTAHGAFSYSYDANLTAGQTNVLQPFFLKADPPLTQFTPIANSSGDQVLTDPRYPGFSMTLPTGVTIMGWDNTVKTGMAFERLSPDRLPVPPPPVEVRAVYQTFFTNAAGVTPMGGFLTPPGSVIPFSIPNDLGLNPGDQAEMWVYDATPLSLTDPAGWKMVGLGTVSADGMSIATNPGVGIDRFCKACGFPTCSCLANDKKKCGEEPGDAKGADPVDLRTGDFSDRVVDLSMPGLFPIQIGRTYNPRDLFSFGGGGLLNSAPILSFGKGWTLSLDITLIQLTNSIRLVLPNTRRLDFVLQPNGTFKNMTDPSFQGAVLQTLGNGDRQLRFKDGRTWTFRALFFPLLGPPLEFLIEQADRNGNAMTIERNGHVITRILDASGRAFTVTTVGERISTIQDPIGRTMSYNYDSSGRLNLVTDPEGGTTSYTYDSEGRLLTIIDSRGNQTIENFYGSSGRVLRQVIADGGEFYLRYEVQGAIVTGPGCPGINCPIEDSWENFQAGFSFDGGTSNETKVIDPRGNMQTVRLNNRGYTTERTNNLGQVTKVIRGSGNLITTQIDGLGRTTTFEYDSAGNVIRSIDTDGNKTEFDYHPIFNGVTEIRAFLDQTNFLRSNFTYDPNTGALLTSTNPDNETTTFSYNQFGQAISVQGPIPIEPPTIFEYDAEGNLTATVDPLGSRKTRGYDAISRLISVTDQRGFTTQFSFDSLNRVRAIAAPDRGLTKFSYDPNGNLLSIIDARNQTTKFSYDDMNRLQARTDALQRTETFAYDANGNQTRYVDRKQQESLFEFDALNRRTQATYTANGTVSKFQYDAAGRLLVADDLSVGRVEFAYNNLDRLIREVTQSGTISYAYDAIGRRTQMIANGQQPITYQYDAASRLIQVVQEGQVVGIGYDDAGRRTSLLYPNGTSTSYSYDSASRLINITHSNSTGNFDILGYTYDPAGNRVSYSRANGTATILPDPMTATYDVANQQIQFNSTTLSYDLNGNLKDDGTNTYQWDPLNRLEAITGTGMSATFQYDALGRRVGKNINGTSTEFIYNGYNIVSEIKSGTVTSRILRGLEVDEIFMRQTVNNEFYHVDALGSVLALTNGQGDLGTTYKYGPFGKTEVSGVSDNSFRYTGRESELTGLYFYRARFYSPSLHRFLSEDPIRFRSGFNFYNYVKNNPLRFTDPFGLTPKPPSRCELSTASGKINVKIPCPEDGNVPPNIEPAPIPGPQCTLDKACFGICMLQLPGALGLVCGACADGVDAPVACTVCIALVTVAYTAACNELCTECTAC